MGKKRANKHFKNKQGKNGSKRPKGDSWKCQTIPDDHPLFKEYYQKQLGLSTEDFTQFWAAMKQKLPVVFRVNPNCANHEAFCNKIEDEEFIKSIIPTQEINEKKQVENEGENAQGAAFEPKQMPKLQLINWYPGHIVYTMNTNKQTFKKSKILAEFHKYLQKSFDSGLISRQELVSMLPPLYLNIKSDDIVLDLCAAPGSKTSQILEMIYGQRRWLAKGCVVANDADYSRAQMLIHQLHRSGTTGMAVINHPGQFLPELFSNKVGSVKHKFQFDKVLCDVPCSGDGATRKLPIKWLNWHTSDGMVLHPLQLSILMKAINLLKKGGYIVYSTCSLNPIENEAVISGLFQKVAKGLQLVDIHPMFGVKGRRGLQSWKVYNITDNYEILKQQQKKEKSTQNIMKSGTEQQKQKPKKQRLLKQIQNYKDVIQNKKIKETMFAPTLQQAKRIHLQYTMRILPHDQNSGGFYVALLRKTQEFEWNYTTNQKKKIQEKGQAEVQQQFVQNNLPEISQPIPQEIGEQDGDKAGENKNEQQQIDSQENEQQNNKAGEKEQEQQILQKQQKQQNQNQNQKEKGDKKWGNKKKQQRGSKYQMYNNISQEDFSNLKKFYGLPDVFKNLLFIRSSNEGQNASKKVLLVSEGVKKFLDADTTKKIKLVNMGCQVFEKGKQSFAGNQCLYRLCQDGIHFILDYLELRKIKVSLEFFKKAISIRTLSHDQIGDEVIKQQVKATSQGSFCIYIDEIIEGRRVIDALVGQNFKSSFHLMVSKQDQASLSIRYLK